MMPGGLLRTIVVVRNGGVKVGRRLGFGGAILSSPSSRVKNHKLFLPHDTTKQNSLHFATMASEMGTVITIDNFASKMSSLNLDDPRKSLYALVDMGR